MNEKLAFLLLFFFLDKNDDDIRTHNEWYENYLELKTKKKEAIRNWRQSRSSLRNLLQTA